MLVRLLTNRFGPGIDEQIGDEIEVNDREASRMISAGQAAACEPEAMIGRTAVETATGHGQRGRRKYR